MNPSRLQNMIELQSPTETSDGGGGFTTEWSTETTDWAEIVTATANNMERRIGHTVQATATHLITLRSYPGISLEWRVQWQDRFSFDGSPVTRTAAIRGVSTRGAETVLAVEELLS
ncbi:MAG: phage head closure protein [Vicinamibacteraceae bacterium]